MVRKYEGKYSQYNCYFFNRRLALLLLESMRKDNIQINTMMYNAAISVCGREGSFDMIKTLLSEMKQYKIPRSVTTYNLLIHACKKEGKW